MENVVRIQHQTYCSILGHPLAHEAVAQQHARRQAFSNGQKRQRTCYRAVATETEDRIASSPGSSQEVPRGNMEVPQELQNSVVRLRASNSSAPGGETDVFILGMSHVSQESVHAVRSLIQAVRPEVVLVELCKDRVGLMLNPDGPKGVQLWTSRQMSVSGLPKSEGWPSQKEILQVVNTRPGRAYSVPDVEADCVRLLETGLFQRVRPSFKRPTFLDAPQFVRVTGDRLATVTPLGPIEFIVTPRVLPNPTGFDARVDSSLANAGIHLPEEEIEKIRQTLLSECSKPEEAVQKSSTQAKEADSEAEKIATAQTENESTKDEIEESEAAEAEDKEGDTLSDQKEGSAKEGKKPQRTPSIDALLRARRSLVSLVSQQLSSPFDVSLNGVETGEVEAVIKAMGPQNKGFRSGFEGSAEGGEGYGIQPFKAQRGPLQISSNLKIPNLAKVLQRMGEHAEDFVQSTPQEDHRNDWRQWSEEEIKAAEAEDDETVEDSFSYKASAALSQLYGAFQAKAGETVGVKPGRAWREALEAAAENGGKQVLLGDMPADLASKNLSDGIWEALSLRVQAAAVVTAGVLTAAVTHILPGGSEGYASAAVAASVSLAVLPFLSPLLEVFLFSRGSAEKIEQTVMIKESLQERGTEMLRLPGEDAIISWPNAKKTIIDARDAYMARTIHAAATGQGASPAFVLDNSEGRHAWQYVMPSQAPEGCSQKGCGMGEYTPIKSPSSVVAVVGSAHVGGIVREWEVANNLEKLSELLGATDEDS